MKAAILAAGRGERLLKGGILEPKPLLCVGGQPLIARAIRSASQLDDVSSAVCIVNDLNPAVAGYLRSETWPIPVEVVVKTTANSMESLFALAPRLKDGPFFLFTVDAVFAPETLERFARRSSKFKGALGVLALTTHVEDEKPLWVRLDKRRRIVALGEAAAPTRLVTAGFYAFAPAIFDLVEEAGRRKMTALRQFLGLLVERGRPLYGARVPKTIDVDRPQDVEKAEAFLRKVR